MRGLARANSFQKRLVHWRTGGLTVLPLVFIIAWNTAFVAAQSDVHKLVKLSIEDLMKVEITSVSKKAQKVSDAAAAVFVITQEDIRRSGVTSIPEALRMAPGVEVARIDANKWAISARGFNSRFANKLLVLMDGRSVYSPMFSGVWWDVQDTMIEDIDRIEVIRGPGATLWGANAVNGVINIITKKAAETRGGLIAAGGGTEEKGFGAVRYGLKLGNDADLRIYAKYFNRDSSLTSAGLDAADQWDAFRTGFRLDHQSSIGNSFTLQGDYYRSKVGSTYDVASITPPYQFTFQEKADPTGGNIIGRWNHTFKNSSSLTVQAYYDRTVRKDSLAGEIRDTVDFDLQHRFKWISNQELVWGFGYRFSRGNVVNDKNELRTFNPSVRDDKLVSAFIQDDISLIENRLHWVIGSKFEHNDYSGFEVQPSTRLIWTPSKTQSIWGAVSRSVRTPSNGETDIQANVMVMPPGQAQNPGPLPIQVLVVGSPDFTSEKLISYELGYRVQALDRLSIDLAGYYNKYDGIRGSETSQPTLAFKGGVPYLLVASALVNDKKVDIRGMELALEWQPQDWLRIKGAYTLAQMNVDAVNTINSAENFTLPRHNFSVGTRVDLRKNVDADARLRYVDSFDNGGVPSYVTMDLRLAWRPVKNLELALVGDNLLKNSHQEFRSEQYSMRMYAIERSVYGKLTLKFQ